MTLRHCTAATFVFALGLGGLTWCGSAFAQEFDHEHREREHRLDECIEARNHHIHELQEHGEISREEAEHRREHAREECLRELGWHEER